MIPQIIFLSFVFIGMLIHANKHGDPMDINWNFWTHLIVIFVELALFYWGGFFDCWR